MSSGRRPPPPDLKGTLGTLLRSTLEQVGAMTEVARRQAAWGRDRVGDALLERRRQGALAALGQQVYELYTSGQLELEDLPELGRAIADIAAIEERLEADEDEAGAPREARSPREAWAGVARTGGDDARARPGAPLDESDRSAPPPRPAPRIEPTASVRDVRWPPGGAAAAEDAVIEPFEEAVRPRASRPAPAAREPQRRSEAPPPKPGITFADDGGPPPTVAGPDDDLADYMNEGDVPARPDEPPGKPRDP
jgi:hypothetical protein